ncbi:hypothetical protein A3D78_03975 [Candidatus Gottesmanbacteria bacterium RIFCSPHIGHO2_02_FULL_39_14]|uniref:Uncharacterized protein n=1 Tax=Candidatus Gottesmanbacteria bacterium RIFCSPHIGHO2_02_FULL_39_14 TaxID=1798383 RepID=A0A1F6A156_9BACT|nr:MAG: hypothetical protein A3D78_03975 [Candidatus Gottesmanbacteria bacterium RIFCSPHIGHO2_02_FULL_39_14]
MKVNKPKKYFFSLISLFVVLVGIFSLFGPTEVYALSCRFPKNIFIGSYQQGTFIDGFVVRYRGTGNWCDTRPVVDDNKNNLPSVFSLVSQNLGHEISTGVYQLSTRCEDRWSEYCAEETTLERLTNNSAELDRYKSEWQQKEQDGLRSVTTQKWSVVAIIIAIVALVILWPWILTRIWPNLRKRVPSFLIIAILLQAPLVLILPGMFIWSHGLWQLTALISSGVLGFSILVEIIFLIVRKIKSRKVTV